MRTALPVHGASPVPGQRPHLAIHPADSPVLVLSAVEATVLALAHEEGLGDLLAGAFILWIAAIAGVREQENMLKMPLPNRQLGFESNARGFARDWDMRGPRRQQEHHHTDVLEKAHYVIHIYFNHYTEKTYNLKKI